jgi:hypothetical protein
METAYHELSANPISSTRIVPVLRDPLAETIELVKSGNKSAARRIILEACRVDPSSAKIWLWRASLAETVLEALNCLEKVLELEPGNPTAGAWFERLRPALVEVPVYHCFLCSYEAPDEFDHCPQCGSILSLNLDTTFRNRSVDERKVRAAVQRLKALTDNADTFDTEYFLGVANLNLLNSHAALVHFRCAESLDQRRTELCETITALGRRPLVMAVDHCCPKQTQG